MKTNLLKIFRLAFGFTLCSVMAASCDSDKLKVSGQIYGAAEKSVVVERADFNGGWTPLDSTKVDRNGNFSLSVASPEHPEIYRLAMDNGYIYFPADGHENISIESSAKDFGRKYTLSGTETAEKMARFDLEAINLPWNDTDSVARFKRKLYTEVMQNGNGDLLSYYFITKQIGQQPLFNPEDKGDARFIAAVATAFQQFNPDDPHAKLLENMGLEAMRRHNKGVKIEAQEVKYFDISLPDRTGGKKELASLVGKGKPVIIAFNILSLQDAPEINKELKAIYEAGKADIYQVCCDPDVHQWSTAAANLPWTVVYEQSPTSSKVLADYNVSEIPTYFLIDASGSLAGRAETPSKLPL